MRTLAIVFVAALCAVVLAAPAAGEPFGAAFLDTGLGARALGMGGAMTAVADGPDAVFYNPAGLVATSGKAALASSQPMSLQRSRTALAASMNPRGDLAFGLAWLHAGVDGVRARGGSGEVVAGTIDNGEDAVFFGLGLAPSAQLQVGVGVKILDQRIDVPQVGESSASGRAIDLGLRYQVRAQTVVGLTVRNLMDRLSWTVKRPSAQTSTSREQLRSGLTLAVAHRAGGGLGAVDLEIIDDGGASELRAHVGAEWRLSGLLTLRGGVHRIGAADGFGLPAFGVSVRPMRIEALQVHYAYVADDLDAGARHAITLGGRFR